MDINNIVATYGAQYLDNGQNQNRLYEMLTAPSEFDSTLGKIITKSDVYQAAESSISEVLQPFTKNWTPKGEVSFKARPIKLFHQKIDLEEYPDDVQGNWLAFLAELDKNDRRKWNILRWIVEKKVIPQIIEDRELEVIYKGVRIEPNAVAEPAGASMDGFKKIMDDDILAGDTATIATGIPEVDPELFVTQIEDFCRQIPELYRMKPMMLRMSYDLADRYAQGFTLKYRKGVTDATNPVYRVMNTNISVRGFLAMSGESRVWATPAGNAVVLKKPKSEIAFPVFQKGAHPREIQYTIDYWEGVGIIKPGEVFVNDQ